MGAGNCYPAAWNAINDPSKGNDWVVVHALRDIFKGAAHYGGHAFLLNKKTNTVYDDSVSAKYIDGAIDDIIDGMPFQEYVDKTYVLTEGDYVYKEYTMKELNMITFENEYHSPFHLAKEMWSLEPKEFAARFPGYDSHADYMKNYFLPTFEPHWEKLKKMAEDVTDSEDVESK